MAPLKTPKPTPRRNGFQNSKSVFICGCLWLISIWLSIRTIVSYSGLRWCRGVAPLRLRLRWQRHLRWRLRRSRLRRSRLRKSVEPGSGWRHVAPGSGWDVRLCLPGNITTSKSAPSMWCFATFYFQMCFAPRPYAIFHLSSGQLAPHPPL